MNFDTETAARYASEKLDLLTQRIDRDTLAVFETGDIPFAVIHFDKFRKAVRDLQKQMVELQKRVDTMSYELLPTLMGNAGVKTITLPEVGRVSINVRWSAMMLDRQAGMDWLRISGNDGLIIETVPAQTLAAFAKERVLAGEPLPDDLFKVGTSQLISITKA